MWHSWSGLAHVVAIQLAGTYIHKYTHVSAALLRKSRIPFHHRLTSMWDFRCIAIYDIVNLINFTHSAINISHLQVTCPNFSLIQTMRSPQDTPITVPMLFALQTVNGCLLLKYITQIVHSKILFCGLSS